MSATAVRPVQPNPMFTEPDLVWLSFDGMWLGLPVDTRPEVIDRAIAALEWMHQGKQPD